MADGIDQRTLASVLAGVRRAQTDLIEWLGRLEPTDVGRPSALPGWTVGHLLTHLARNADSHVRMLAGQPQYPGGVEQRNAEIDAGCGRPWDLQLADLSSASEALDAAWTSHADWGATALRLVGTTRMADLPFLRWREVEVHRIDLGLGATFADLPGEYLRRELATLTMRYRASKPIGLTQLPEAVARVEPALRLAWLTGRAELSGVAPAGIF